MGQSESGSVSGLYESFVDMVSAFNEAAAKGAPSSYADRIVDSLSAFRDVVKGGKVPGFNVVIDYFKVEFLWKFDVDSPLCHELFSLLRLPDAEGQHDECRGRDNFDSCWAVALQTFVLFSPSDSAGKKNAADYFILEMTGQGCMAFEARGGNWLDLITWINSHLHEVKRIDLAGDDMGNICPLSEVKEKVNSRCYVSNFRSRNTVRLGNQEYVLEPTPVDPFGNSIDVKDYQKGYSVTWGRKDNLQLQIYDKKAERLAKGVSLVVDSSIRYEMRFGASRGDVVLLLLEVAYQKCCVGTLYSCLLRWCLEFKENSNYDRAHLYMANIWKPYSELLGASERISVPVRQKDMEASISRARSWVSNQWASTAKVLIAIDPEYFNSVLALALRREYKRHGISEQEFSMIQTFLYDHPELGRFDRDTCVANVEDFIRNHCPYSGSDDDGSDDVGSEEDEFGGAYDAQRY